MKRLHTYSQNFLTSQKVVETILDKAKIKKDSLVYDLGAGSGLISSVLANRVERVVAVEFDERLKPTLERNLISYGNVQIILGDALKTPFPDEPFSIVANIPFHISSPLVQRFIHVKNAPEAAYLIVQKQFGRKLESHDTHHFTSQLGMVLGAEYQIKVVKELQPSDFYPRPAVDTVCVELLKRKAPLVEPYRLEAYKKFTIECFADPKVLAKMPISVLGIAPGHPPSRLTLTQWIILFHSQTVY